MAEKPLAERIFVGASKGYRDFRGAENLPADKRIFMESVIDKRRDPITERSFNPREISTIRNLIVSRYDRLKDEFKQDVAKYRANAQEALREANAARDPEVKAWHLKRFRNLTATRLALQEYLSTGKLNPKVVEHAKGYNVPAYIRREDYENPDEINVDTGASLSTGGRDTDIGQTLGRFNYTVDDVGNINITDTYDFGSGHNPLTGAPTRNKPINVGDLIPPKQAAAKLGFRELPEGRGRPVSIRINSIAPKPKKKANWFSQAASYLGF